MTEAFTIGGWQGLTDPKSGLSTAKLRQGLGNIARYDSPTLLPPVDPIVMGALFSRELGKLPFATDRDHLSLRKYGNTREQRRQSMHFNYSHEGFTWVNGTIFARLPRRGFELFDDFARMSIDMLAGTPIGAEGSEQEAILGALANVMRSQGITARTYGLEMTREAIIYLNELLKEEPAHNPLLTTSRFRSNPLYWGK